MTEAPSILIDDTRAPRPSEPHDGPDDDMLVTMHQAGDVSAFRVLVERHESRVRHVIRSVLGRVDLVDDLTQDVFLKVWQALGGFRFDSRFTTWLYRITINRCRDELRRRKLRSLLSLQMLHERGDRELERRTSVQPEDPETPALVQAALDSLPDAFRIPIILKDIEGLSYEEMAEIMQVELGTVKSRLSRARGMMRARLAPLLHGEG